MNPQNSKGAHSKIFRSIILSAAMLSLVFSISAKSLENYRKSIQTARYSVDELKINFTDNDSDTTEKGDEYKRELISLIRENLPPNEKIEWQGSSVETSNQWVSDRIDAFVREENPDKRAEILTVVDERLDALQEKLTELENAAVSERTKDEDKRKLAEILQRENYQKPEQPEESLLEKWWRQLLEWLQSVFPKPNLSAGESVGFSSFSYVLQIVLYALIAGVIGFLLYKFAPFLFSRYAAKEKREKKERVILGERIAAGDSAENLFGEAETLAREGNLRAAIRKGYIAILCDLSDKKIISPAQHKTNRDYLRDVRKRRELFENMNDLTNSYERHWYGAEPTGEADWNEFRQEYKKVVSESH